MRLAISEALCQGHGRCYELAPELFTDDEYGRAWVVDPDVPDHLAEQARASVAACPERAITVTE